MKKKSRFYTIMIITFSFLFIVGYVYAWGAGDDPGGHAGDIDCDITGTTNVTDSYGNAVGVGCGGCDHGGGGDGGGDGSYPTCIPCTESCTSDANACGQVNIGTKDICCGNGVCSAVVPDMPTFDKDGVTVRVGDECTIGNSGKEECNGNIDCSGGCTAPCLQDNTCLSSCYVTPPPPPPPPPITCERTEIIYTDTNIDTNTSTSTSSITNTTLYQIAKSQTQTLTQTDTTTYIFEGSDDNTTEEEYTVKLISLPKIVKKGDTSNLLLLMKNVDACDIASSDGRFWGRVGINDKVGEINMEIIPVDINQETKFTVTRCYVQANNLPTYIATTTDVVERIEDNLYIIYIPVQYGWTCVNEEESEEIRTCDIGSIKCVYDDGSVEQIDGYNICSTQTNDAIDGCRVNIGNINNIIQWQNINPSTSMGTSNVNINTYTTMTDPELNNFFGNILSNNVDGEFVQIPLLNGSNNDIEETIFIAPDWQEQ